MLEVRTSLNNDVIATQHHEHNHKKGKKKPALFLVSFCLLRRYDVMFLLKQLETTSTQRRIPAKKISNENGVTIVDHRPSPPPAIFQNCGNWQVRSGDQEG